MRRSSERDSFLKDKIKCGVLGAGWWATFAHIPALLSDPRAELIGIQTQDREQARKVAADFGIPHPCTTTAELLALDGLEAVVVSSSPSVHYAQAAAALRAGMHVLIEKPMTLTAQQARELLQLAEQRKLQFLISCPWHYTAHAAAAQRLIREGKLGKLRMISMLMTNPVSHLIRGEDTTPTHGDQPSYTQPQRATYSDPAIAGGGQIYAQVRHVAAYLAFLTGLGASEVFAHFHNDGARLDIYNSLALRLDDGTLVSISSTGATSLTLRSYEVRIFGTEGMLYLELWRGTMRFIPMRGEEQGFPDLPAEEIYPHQAPARNLIDAIFDPASNRSPAALGVVAMEMIEAACTSAASGQNIAIPRRLEQNP